MSDFQGFVCKAVVVLPTDQEFQRRVVLREAKEGKEIPDSAVLNMKGKEYFANAASVESEHRKTVTQT